MKSDDVAGRTRMYESIVKGENVLDAGLPESLQRSGQGASSARLSMSTSSRTRKCSTPGF